MDYTAFKYGYSSFPIILSSAITDHRRGGKPGKTAQSLLNQMTRWQKRGLVVKLKKGMYLLNEHDRRINPSRLYLANQMYTPSYVSLEYALSYYGLIPERAVEVSSVTTKKTFRISNPTGRYSYQHLSISAFQGFHMKQDENGLNVFIAEPEKAVLDFLYFNLARTLKKEQFSVDIFSESYRFQDVGLLNEKRFMSLAALYNNPQLSALAKLFCAFRKEQVRT